MVIAAMLMGAVLFGAGPAGARTVAVVPFGDAAKGLAADVRAAVAEVGGVSLQPQKATDDELKSAADAGVVCGVGSDECLVKLALFARVGEIVSLGAVRSERGLELELVLVDAALARRTASVTAPIPEGDGRAAAVRDAVFELMVPQRVLGSLLVSTTPAGARIFVDGLERGVSDAPLSLRVRKGPHDIEARLEGHAPARAHVEVPPGAETKLPLTLHPVGPRTPAKGGEAAPQQNDGVSRATIGMIGGLIGGGLLLGGAVTAIALDVTLNSTGAGDASQRDAMLGAERVAAVVAVVGGAMLVGGLALALFGGE